MIKRFLVNDYVLFFAITMVVNAGNYGVNLFLGRFLGPAYFSEANILATLVLMISFIGVAFQLTSAKYMAQKNNDHPYLGSMLIVVSRRAGLILALLLLLSTPWLADYLNFLNLLPLCILFAALPFYFIMSAQRGILQGQGNFKTLGRTYLSEMVSRLLVTVVLVYVLHSIKIFWYSEAIALGFALSFIASHLTAQFKVVVSKFQKIEFPKGLMTFFIVILAYELCQIFINNSDVVLVKHFFENETAGLYSALALIGRVVFFATWIMVTLLFPKVIQRKEAGKDTTILFMLSIGGVAVIGLSIVLICFIQGPWIIQSLFGNAYLPMGSILWLYALATALFSCANVFVYYHLSLGNYYPVAISLLAGISQVIGIYWFHQSLIQVIEVQIFISGSLLAILTITHLSRLPLSFMSQVWHHSIRNKNIINKPV